MIYFFFYKWWRMCSHKCINIYSKAYLHSWVHFSRYWSVGVKVKAGPRAAQGAEGTLTLTPLYLASIFTRWLSGSAQPVSYWSEFSVFWSYISPPLSLFLQRYHLIKTNWQSLYRSVTPEENRCASLGPLPRPARDWYILPSPDFSLFLNCSLWIFFFFSFQLLCSAVRAKIKGYSCSAV